MATVGGGDPYVVTQLKHVIGTSGAATTTSTSYVDLPDLALTLTTAGGDLLAWLQCDWSLSAATGTNGIAFSLALDGAAETFTTAQNPGQANFTQGAVCIGRFTGVAAGPHTLKGRWQVITSGTATAQTTRRVLMLAEVRR